ncbi:MAG: CoA transferase, partial [Pseudomonadota bacterium]
ITAGIIAAMGCLAAYAHAQATGQGQKVDTSLYEAAITQTYWQSAITFATGEPPGPMGSAHPLNAPYQAFRTKDGWINIGAANQKNWLRLLDVIGAQQLNDDPRFATNRERMLNLDALVEVLNGYLDRETTDHWLHVMEHAGLPAGPVRNVAEMHGDPQTQAREMVVSLDHPVAGQMDTLGHPIKFSHTPAQVARPAPVLGQHSREVLLERGIAADRVEMLISQGAVVAPS